MAKTDALHAGELLVSTASDDADFFHKSVVLLLEHDDTGSIGLILNKPSKTAVAKILPDWADLVNPPDVFFGGGPVRTNSALCLAKVLDDKEQPPGWDSSIGDIGLLHLQTPIELVAGAYSDIRIYAGYSGWEPGQLDAEIKQNAWIRCTPRHEDIFGSDVRLLWRRVLTRTRGDGVLLSGYTDHPEQN